MNSQIVKHQKPGILPAFAKRIGWAVLLLFAIFPVMVSLGYLTLNPENFSFADQRVTYTAHLTMLMMHIVGAMLAILIGPFQFLPGIRRGRWLKLHRWLGRTYLLSVLFGGLAGLYMAQFSYGGMVTHLGFGALAVSWLYSGYRAYRHIRNKEIEQHRQWMIRNYALTFAGVMLRIYVPLSGAIGIDFLTAYRAIGWLCWVPNLLVAEWIIRRTLPARLREMVLGRRETHQAAQTEA
jgi:uncharacterized membrane protein